MIVHRLPPSLALLLFSTLAGSGCNGLNFDRQELALSFPRDRPEVRVLLVYEGLRVRGEKAEDLKLAKEQMTELFADRQGFWLGDSELTFRFSLQKPPPDEDRHYQALLHKHLTIDRVELFTLPDGRLCAYQTLTVREPAKFVARLNTRLTADLARSAREELAKPAAAEHPDVDRATWRLIEEACRGKFEWLRVEPGRISLTTPASPAFSRWLKSNVLCLEELGDLEAAIRGGKVKVDEKAGPFRDLLRLRARLGNLSDMPWSLDQRADRLTLSLGYGGGEPIRVAPRPFPSPPASGLDKDLRAFARRLEILFRERVEVETVVEKFLRETQRKNGK
jgi:hypothetical protein